MQTERTVPTWREHMAANPPREPWKRARRPTHPGELIREWLEGGGITQDALAAGLRMTRVHLNRVINGRSDVTVEMALRLGRALGTSVEFWLNLQRSYDLWRAYDRIGPELDAMALIPQVEARLDEPMYELR